MRPTPYPAACPPAEVVAGGEPRLLRLGDLLVEAGQELVPV
jgi:hypothetical protein